MTPNEIGQILKELGGIKAVVHQVQNDIADLKDDLQKEADGFDERVSKIERQTERAEIIQHEHKLIAAERAADRQRWGGWFMPIVSGSIAGIIVTVAALLITGNP